MYCHHIAWDASIAPLQASVTHSASPYSLQDSSASHCCQNTPLFRGHRNVCLVTNWIRIPSRKGSMMKLATYATPDVRRLMDHIKADESAYDSESRASQRIKLIRPVTVSSGGNTYQAFSRDISTRGICLISSFDNELGKECSIQIQNTDHEFNFTGTCRWKSTFGASHWISGWQLDDHLDVSQLESENSVALDNRQEERIKAAVPVEIRGGGPATHAFSLNLSGTGICLVTEDDTPSETLRLLRLTRRNSESCEVVAKCRWSRAFGDSHWLSGWDYPKLDRTQRFYRQLLG